MGENILPTVKFLKKELVGFKETSNMYSSDCKKQIDKFKKILNGYKKAMTVM